MSLHLFTLHLTFLPRFTRMMIDHGQGYDDYK